LITNNAYSPSIFKEYRRKDGFISTDLIVLDIDDDMTLQEAEKVIHELDVIALAIPTTSHTEEHHRFRLLFPVSKSIRTLADFEATNRKLAEYFPADPSTLSDTARFFFGSKLVDGFAYVEGSLLEPVIDSEKPVNRSVKPYDSNDTITVGEDLKERVEALYGETRTKIPEAIADFLENAPDNLAGRWFHASNRFLYTCGLSGLDKDHVMTFFFELYPWEELTEEKVEKMIQDGIESREEEL